MFARESVPASAWATSSMWHMNLGTTGARPSDVEWDAAEEPPGIAPALFRPLRWALYNHGVDLMGNGGMVSSSHGAREVEDTVTAMSAARSGFLTNIASA